MSTKEQIKISACLMVKNEEELLPQCLESIHDLVDEIIVVDTGSEDRTVEIAKSYGAKVYHHPWENNFSKHRNQSISYATGDWFLIIDADEKVKRDNLSVEKIRTALANVSPKKNAVLATVVDYKRSGTENVRFKSARFFRNNAGVHYAGTVHNKPTYTGQAVNSDLHIFHYGYDLDKEKMQAKFKRTTSLLKQRINENPGDFEAYFYLANSYGSEGMFEESIKYAQQSIDLMPDDLPDPRIYYSAYFAIASGYYKLGDIEQAKDWALQGLERNEYDLGLLFILTQLGMQLEEFEISHTHAVKYLESYDIVKNDPVIVGGQFTFHTDERSKQVVEYRLLTVKLILDDMDGFHELWDSICDRIYSDDEWKLQVLTNIAAANKSELLLEKTVEILQHTPEEFTLLNPLAASIAKPENSSLHEKTIVALQAGEKGIDYLCYLSQWLRKNDKASKAMSLLKGIKREASNVKFTREMLAVYNALNLTEEAMNLVADILKEGETDQDLLEDIIKTAYALDRPQLLEQAVTGLAGQVQHFEELNEVGLLALALKVPESGQLDTLVQIAQILYERKNMQDTLTITSLEDFAMFFSKIGHSYSEQAEMFCAQLCFELAFLLSNDFQHLDALARLFLDLGNYQGSIRYFNRLLQQNYKPQSTLKSLQYAFNQIGDSDAAEKCSNLLQQFTS